jgi:hypothetical protein
MDQRYIGLRIESRQNNILNVKTPQDSTLAPPGYYMLFIIKGNTLQDRIPSIAKFIRLS